MIEISRILLLLMVFATLVIFSIVGISRFPDYDNYLYIAEGGGFVVSERDYLFEWISRLILNFDSLSAIERVDLLALVNQSFCVIFFVWVGLKVRLDRVHGSVLLFSLLGFMFMTTTLRASIAYLSIAVFFLRGFKFDFVGIGLLLFSMAWHDSAAPVVTICFAAYGLASLVSFYCIKKQTQLKAMRLVVIIAGVVFLLVDLFRPYLANLGNVDFGARAAYFANDGMYSLSKSLFVLFAIICCYFFVSDSRQSFSSRTAISLLALSLSMFHAVSGVVSVRFAFFIFCIILPLRGVFAFEFERRLEVRIVELALSPFIFALSILYIFSNSV